MNPLPIFVFGTLRLGESNHHYLAGAYRRVLPAILPGFRRGVAPHGFPAAIPDHAASVDGELYFLDPDRYAETLAACDALEDLPPGELVGEFYRRAAVQVETAEGTCQAWAYIDPDPEGGLQSTRVD